jgi:hypothetical protein
VMRNMLPPADAARGLHVRVLDGKGRATLAGAEVRVFAAGTTRLIGARLVDSGSGYDAQNDMPVHFGIPAGTASFCSCQAKSSSWTMSRRCLQRWSECCACRDMR